MKRRDFIKAGGVLTVGGRSLVDRSPGTSRRAAGSHVRKAQESTASIRAKDVQAYLRSLNGGWVNLENTVDTFKAGDPETAVTGIGVAWMSTSQTLRQALDRGLNLFITHEPTYYSHRDDDVSMFEVGGAAAKKKWIEDSGIVILRCHDLWDRYPGMGIPDAWARFLGFSDPVGGEGYFRVFDVSGKTAGEIARRVASKVSALGQQAVQLIGSESQEVRRMAIGTGAITPYVLFLKELGADLALCSDDGFTYWRDGALAIDLGLPVIIVNHPVSEEYGMKLLAEHLAGRFPGIPVEHLPQTCMYSLIRGESPVPSG